MQSGRRRPGGPDRLAVVNHARTRIVCTLGPASSDVKSIAGLISAGADVLRLNGAHVKGGELRSWVVRVRRASRQAGREVAVMVDLPGVKLRVGSFRDGPSIELEPGSEVTLTGARRDGDPWRIPVHPWPDARAVRKGQTVLLADGQLRLQVIRRRGEELVAVVEEGGELLSGKGVAFPGVPLGLDVPTRRDRALARAAVHAGADWLALSFVRAGEDLRRLRATLRRAGASSMPVAAKIERRDALPELEDILRHSEAVMVARGDLGVDVGGENVPALQKQIVQAAHAAGRPVIIATEMLDSMTHRVRPTRAEVSDVAGAVYEGTDAVLLSGETAVGEHPVLAVTTLDRILTSAEEDDHAPYAGGALWTPPTSAAGRPDQHVVHAAVQLARTTEARAIVVFTRSGQSAMRLAKERPRATIHAFAPSAAVCRRLTLAWGVEARRMPGGSGTDAIVRAVTRRLRTEGALTPGDRAVLVMGGAKDPAGATTLIKLLTC